MADLVQRGCVNRFRYASVVDSKYTSDLLTNKFGCSHGWMQVTLRHRVMRRLRAARSVQFPYTGHDMDEFSSAVALTPSPPAASFFSPAASMWTCNSREGGSPENDTRAEMARGYTAANDLVIATLFTTLARGDRLSMLVYIIFRLGGMRMLGACDFSHRSDHVPWPSPAAHAKQ